MKILSATFVKSSPGLSRCPSPSGPEYAFIGRSNVGKSSLINMLVGRRDLAKTSGTPGKTQLINHFVINEQWFLVDLPGYGFARVARAHREKWQKTIRNFITGRHNLVCTFILIDIRLEPQQSDLDFLAWMGENRLPFVIVFTKTDKLSKARVESNLSLYMEKLEEQWEELPEIIQSSTRNMTGRDEILEYIDVHNKIFDAHLSGR